MKQIFSITWMTLLALLLATGCENDKQTSLGADESDEMLVEELATSEESDLLYDVMVNDGSEDNMYNGFSTFDNGIGKVSVPIETVLRFGRRFDPYPRRSVRDVRRISRDSILVTTHRVFAGNFVIFERGVDDGGTRPIIVHRKPMRHLVNRRAIYVLNDDRTLERRWQLAAVSPSVGKSLAETTIDIMEVHISSDQGVDITISNPLETLYDSRDQLPTFVPGEVVTVQVKLDNATLNPVDPEGNGATETLLLHFGINREHRARVQFHYTGIDPATGAQVYQGRWTIHQRPGRIYHTAIDAIDNGTIYDTDVETYPYNSLVWSTPYRVVESK